MSFLFVQKPQILHQRNKGIRFFMSLQNCPAITCLIVFLISSLLVPLWLSGISLPFLASIIPSLCSVLLIFPFPFLFFHPSFMLSCSSCIRLFATLWTRLLSLWILQVGMLEWVAISFSRECSQLRDWTHVSYVFCTGRWILDH